MNDEDWGSFWVLMAAFAMVAICTASVAYWAQSANGLWSMLVFLIMEVRIGESSRQRALIKAQQKDIKP